MEFAVRFPGGHVYLPYDGKLDVEEHVDEGIIKLAKEGKSGRSLPRSWLKPLIC